MFIDARTIKCKYVRAGPRCSGVHKSPRSILPFKFQERQLVGTFVFLSFVQLPFNVCRKAQTGIELKAFRCHKRAHAEPSGWVETKDKDPHWGRISELSKKAGWRRVAYVPSLELYFPRPALILLLMAPPSVGDEMVIRKRRPSTAKVAFLDPWRGPPYASIKIFYRPRGGSCPNRLSRFFPELLRAQGVFERCGEPGIPDREQDACHRIE